MKILVAVKRVVDAYVKIKVKADQTDIDTTNLKMAINPFCEIAVEQAVRLKEAGIANEIIVVTVGNKAAQEQIRTSMALGADRGVHIETDDVLQPISIAKLLKAVQEKEQADLILLGKQSIDGDNNQTGQMLAALLNLPQATFASKLEINDNQLIVEREIDGGTQTLSMSLPAIVTADLRLNEPRYAKLPDIMKAKRKPIDVFSIDDLQVVLKNHQKVIQVTPPPQRKSGVMVSSTAELVDKLKNEAKVI